MGRSHSHVSQNVIKISMGFITIFEILQNGFFLYQFVSRSVVIKPLSANPHKVVKHTQTILRLLATNHLSVLDHFPGLALKELMLHISGKCSLSIIPENIRKSLVFYVQRGIEKEHLV